MHELIESVWPVFPGSSPVLHAIGHTGVLLLYAIALRSLLSMTLIVLEQTKAHGHEWRGKQREKGDLVRYFLTQNACGCRYAHSLLDPLAALTQAQQQSINRQS